MVVAIGAVAFYMTRCNTEDPDTEDLEPRTPTRRIDHSDQYSLSDWTGRPGEYWTGRPGEYVDRFGRPVSAPGAPMNAAQNAYQNTHGSAALNAHRNTHGASTPPPS